MRSEAIFVDVMSRHLLIRNICLAFGQSDKYSCILRKGKPFQSSTMEPNDYSEQFVCIYVSCFIGRILWVHSVVISQNA